MKKYYHLSTAISLTIILALFGCVHVRTNTLFQLSTIQALLEGVYDGEMTCDELKKHGDFGVGTFNAVDGEMIELDGKFFQIKSDGVAYSVDGSMILPFATVTFFKPEKIVTLNKDFDLNQVEQFIDHLLPTQNIFYAIKIEGNFKYIKTRSVPKQKKPYPRLIEALKNQPTFEFHNVKGVILGFYCPDYAKGINVPGYHLHFIDDEKKSGGHLLECQIESVKGRPSPLPYSHIEAESRPRGIGSPLATASTAPFATGEPMASSAVKIEIDEIRNFKLALPKDDQFNTVNLSEDKKSEINKIEK